MNVKELIQKLEQYNEELEIVIGFYAGENNVFISEIYNEGHVLKIELDYLNENMEAGAGFEPAASRL
jgi:hypothetical protein